MSQFEITVRNLTNSEFEIFGNISTKGACRWNSLNTGMMCILVVTFILNLLSSIVLFRVPLVTVRGRSNPVYLCIRFLNICDVMQAFLLIVMPAFATSDCGWMGGRRSCDFMGFLVLFFLLVSPLITILMAFDRVIALYQPFKYRSHLGLKMLKILLPIACFCVLILTILPIFNVGNYHVVKGRRFCLLDTITDDPVGQAYVISVHAIFFLALVFMMACTVTFQMKLVRMTFNKKHDNKNSSRKQTSSRRTRNATMTTMAVCCIFVVCYMPYVVRVLFEASSLQKSPLWITWITFGLSFFQPLLNPVVYMGTNSRYRQELQAMLKNLSATEISSSSDSAGTNVVSRGPWAGFIRRLSVSSAGVGGKAGSRRGSGKRRLGSSHASTQNPTNNNITDAGRGRRSSNSTLNRITGDVNTSRNTLYDAAYVDHQNGHCYLRNDPSSSSGIKSSDSKDRFSYSSAHMQLSPVMISGGSLSRYFGEDGKRYGRGERRELSAIYSEDGDAESEARERSNTVSGDKSPGKVNDNLYDKSHCISVPLLSENKLKKARMDAKAKKDAKRESKANEMTSQYLDIPQYTSPKYSNYMKSLPTEAEAKYKSCISSIDSIFDESRKTSSDENASSNDDSAVVSECLSAGVTETKLARQLTNEKPLINNMEHASSNTLPLIVQPEQSCNKSSHPVSFLSRTEARSSYKRALTSPMMVERKPSKRDSGVDADDI